MADLFDSHFEYLSNLVGGVPIDQVKLVVSMLVFIPLGLIMQFIQGRVTRHCYGLFFGLFFQYIVYKNGIISHLFESVLVYLIVKNFRGSCGKLVFVVSLVFLSIHHIYRQWTDYGGWTMDVTTILMMATAKYTSFAYCVQDGQTFKKNDSLREDLRLSEDQILRKLDTLPSFFEYFSYIHFFGSCLCGPSFDFYDFQIFINNEKEFQKLPITECLKQIGKKLLETAFFMFFAVVVLPYFPINYLASEEFGQKNFFYQFFILQVTIVLMKFRYYSGWTLAEAGITSTGFTYSGNNSLGEAQWNRTQSCNAFAVETSSNFQTKVSNWNISIQVWLKKYVYLRLYTEQQIKKSKTKQFYGGLYTFLISAFWHGFYPGYYIGFMHWYILLTINKFFFNWEKNEPRFFQKIRKSVTPLVYDTLCVLVPNIIWNYCGNMFQLLEFQRNWAYFINTKYFYNIGIYIFFALTFTGIGQRSSKPREEKKIDNQENKKTKEE